MKEKEYLAHSKKDGYPAQLYTAHIQGVCEQGEKIAEEIKPYCRKDADLMRNVIKQSAEDHDIGKIGEENQVALHKEENRERHLPINHVDAGAAYLKQKGQDAMLSMLLVYSHHHGLPDLAAEANRSEHACYRDEDEKVRKSVDQELEQMFLIHRQLVPEREKYPPEECNGDPAVFLRMALSCLVDADHSDTARAYGKPTGLEHMPELRAEDRLKKLDCYVEVLRQKEKSERNELRTKMYMECRDCEVEDGIVSNDGPVGSGKTTAIMAYLLRQAIVRNARRIFVILPYTNIITQSVEIYRKALVVKGENPEEVVAELHHKADFESEDTRHLTALWRAPIIVTTAVTFFETLASNRPSTLRRLHELPGSVIFMDEAHAALPLKLLPIAWRWMRILEKEWNCHWVLASGSLVRFWQIPELMGVGVAQNSAQMESEDDQVLEMLQGELHQKLQEYEKRRIRFCYKPQPQSCEELMDWVMTEPGPRLLIMNTVQSAAVMADDICRTYGRQCVEHLSTALVPEDREDTINRIKERLERQDANWVLVSTSCVEAGMDFSFRIGFREMSSVLSLLQTAGRIDRNGKEKNAQVWSFCMQDDVMLTQNPEIKVSARLLEEYFQNGEEITSQLSTRSIRDEMNRRKNQKDEIQELLYAEDNFSFQKVNDKFHVIESDTVPAIVDANLVEQIKEGRGNWRMVQKYSVSIRRSMLEKWKVRNVGGEVYQWTLPYDSFLGYMTGVLQQGK